MKIHRQKLWRLAVWGLGILCLLALCLFGIREARLDAFRQQALLELEDREGEYDPQTIVLSGTNTGRARNLANLLGAELRITTDGSFATLTLPAGTDIRDVYANNAYRELLPELSADYMARISDLEEEDDETTQVWHHTRPRYPVSDPGFAHQSYLDYLNLDNVWQSYQGSGVLVAVIDTGIDTDHPEFAGRISEYSYNATDDHVVRDHGLSVIEDVEGHGTAVAGVIGAAMDGSGTVGVAPGVELLVIKAETDGNGNFLRTSDLVFGLYYAIERGADVVNMSFGTSVNVFEEAARLAWDSDIICVAAAGNEATTTLTYPAADPLVLGVGALAADSWELADYSNYGDNVDLVAPGTVYTTGLNGGYGAKTGTSLASPAVAGTLALRLTGYGYASPDQVWEDLFASCRDLGSLGADWLYGYGAVDANALVLEEKGTVTFNMQTDELDDLEQIFVRNHTLQAIPEPERLYAVFDGWYYDPQCTEEYQWYADAFTSDLTLYAKWANEDDSVPYTYVTLADGTVEIRSYTGHRRYITIPDEIDGKPVTAIGLGAFQNETRLREVHLPQNLKTICDMAFEGCTNLAQIRIPDTVTAIGAAAFKDNTRLNTVAFGSGSALTSIGGYAFTGCASLERFELPARLEHMDGTALFGTVSLDSIGVRSGNRFFAARDGVLFDKTGAALVAYPAGRSGSYTVPDSVRTVGICAFGYTRAANVDLNRVRTLGDSAFANSALETLTVADSVTEMGVKAFCGSDGLKQVTLGKGLQAVSGEAFRLCTALEQIQIPETVTQIGSAAFQACASLKTVTFAENSTLAYIGSDAFSGTGLESIRLPASLAVISDGAFQGNYALTEVTFETGSGLTAIGSEAFRETPALTDISLPAGLGTLGHYAFCGSGLTAVTVPASVERLGDGVFADCHDLTAITVEAGNQNYVSTDGVVYTSDKTSLVNYPAGKPDTWFSVPNTVTAVSNAAFFGSRNLTWVEIPGSVKTVGEYGFYDCRNVTTYTLNEGLEEIGSYSFSRNTALNWLDIPASVTQINRFAFAENNYLYQIHIPDDTAMTRLGYAAFANTGLAEFRVPANVTTMAQGVFEDCPNLYNITFAAGSKLDILSAYTFDGCANLSKIIFEPGSALTTVAAHGFEGMSKLRQVDFGDAEVTEIGNYAFRFCENLQTLEVPDTLVNIGRFAFYGCESLESLTLPENLEHIGSFAFYGADKLNLYFASDFLPLYLDENWDDGLNSYHVGVSRVLTQGDWKYALLNSGKVSIIEYLGSDTTVDLTALNLGADIVGIGGHAFADSAVTRVILPDSLTTIQAFAFSGSALESVSIPANVEFIGRSAFENTPLTNLTFAQGCALRVLEQDAFAGTENLTEITLPRSLTVLGSRAFRESGLKTVTFEPGIALKTIPAEAFAGSGLAAVVIPDSVTLIDDGAFRDCRSLTSVTLGAVENLYIGSNAFYNTALTTVDIPANVAYIGEYAFVGLEKLESFTVSADNAWYKAEDGLLMSKDGRKLIAVPGNRTGSLTVPQSVEVIGFGAFENSKLSSVTFPADCNILTLGYRAFYGAKNLRQITVPASVVSIDYYAFATCENLEKVIFAEGSRLTGVYEGAFYGCGKLSAITLPDTVVEISEFAFYGCTSLDRIPVSGTSALKGIYDYAFAYAGITDLMIPETVTDIGEYAFMGIRARSITVPDTNKKELVIGIGAFADCGELEEITLPFIGASFEDPDITWAGYIFGAGGFQANAAYTPAGLKTITVTEGITEVPDWAFCQMKTLERINLPHSIVSVGQSAFAETVAAYELTNTIYLEDGVYYAFGEGITGTLKLAQGLTKTFSGMFYNTDLVEVILPDSLTYIADSTFSQSEKLERINIPDGVAYIGEWAFFQCHALKEIRIPGSVEEIGRYSFSWCENLSSIQISEGVKRIGEAAFSNCPGPKQLIIPDSVTAAEQMAFFGWTNLMELTLGSGLTEIQAGTFSSCQSLYQINNRSSLNVIPGSHDYDGLAANARVVINADGSRTYRDDITDFIYTETPEGFLFAYENGAYTLMDYRGGEDTVTLPLTVNGSEYTIDHLAGIRHLVIPEGFTHIDDNAFAARQVNSPDNILESVVIPDTVTSIGDGAFSGARNLKTVLIPDSVTVIKNNAFSYCQSLEEILLPKNLTNISVSLFYECASLREIVIPEGVRSIDPLAFYNCSALTTVYIPKTLNSISDSFSGCEKLANLIISPENSYFRVMDGLLYNSDLTQLVLVPSGVSGHVEIPDTVTYLPFDAFKGRTGLTSVVLPEGLTTIPVGAFSGCTALKTVVLPSTVETIDNSAFYDCVSLEHITLPAGLTRIEAYAFRGCSGLKELALPDGLTELGLGAFQECSALTEIHLPDSLQNIGGSLLENCDSLAEITLPEGITEIPDSMFWGCDSLTEFHIPDTVTAIGYGAFYECFNLETVTIPDGVTAIGANAFGWCMDLRNVKLPDSVASIGDMAFHLCRALPEIEIPDAVTELGAEAFLMCGGLQRVVIGDGMTSIPWNAFNSCGSLVELTLGKGLTWIDDSAFNGGNMNIRVIHNNSSLDLTLGSESCGGVAQYARKIVNGDGTVEYADGYEDYAFIDTADGLRFAMEDGEYVFLGYLGDQETVTLPASCNGQAYRIASMGGLTHVTIPRGVLSVDDCAAQCNGTLKSLTVEGDLTVGGSAFSMCQNLERVSLGDGVRVFGGAFSSTPNLTCVALDPQMAYIGIGVFDDSNLMEQERFWHNGCMIIDGHLIRVREDVEYLDWDFSGLMAEGALVNAYSLKQTTMSGSGESTLTWLTNLESLIFIDDAMGEIYLYFGGNIPMTLKDVVIREGADIQNGSTFWGVYNVDIFVEEAWADSGAVWDVSFPDWNNGNKVYYGDEWSTVCFYDVDGNLISREFVLNHQVVRQPYYAIPADEQYEYTLVGWDIDGDGMADHIPATTSVDLHAHPVVEISDRKYTVTFYDKDGRTPIYVQHVAWGHTASLPQDPTKTGYSFLGWSVDVENLTVTADTAVYSRWEHTGDGHTYGEGTYVAPTCTEPGGIRHTCTACGEWYLATYEAATGHSYRTDTVPGCEEEGYDLHTCTACGHSYRDNYTEAQGHAYGGWTQTQAPTCSAVGKESRTCGHCGRKQTREVPALPHTDTGTVTREPTCTESGEITYRCGDCGATSTAELPPVPHRYERKEVSADVLEKLMEQLLNFLWGHDGDVGYYFVCADCGTVCTVEEAGSVQSAAEDADCSHTDGEWTVAVEEADGQPGILWRVCGLCGKALEARTYTGVPCVHQWGLWETVKPPTREEPGERQRTCTLCGAVETGEIPVLDFRCGDCNADGFINGKDLILLRQSLAGWDVEVDMDAADCNADGKINGKDLILLRQHLAGWDVVLG